MSDDPNDPIEPMDPELRSLLRRGSAAPSVPAGAFARVRAGVTTAISKEEGLARGAGPEEPSPTRGAGGDGAIASVARSKALITAAIGAIIGAAAGFVAGERSVQPEVRVVYVPLPSAPAPIASPPVPSSAPNVVADPSAAGAARPQVSAAPPVHSLQAERLVLDDARTAFMRGEPGACLAALEKHAQRFPNGRLSEEREALAVRALASMNRMEEARARAARFRERYPESLMLPAVEAAIGERREGP